ncbi:uncharacterized protein LOC114351767 [Ostrinia furnacalis]|uniref:uncharacterized protein LOC114351767 n=1 Tax=Ostrinia furnacalis TaxID=93504 RepID=UPI00103EB8EA|nr:uncharacterized protein LOC114351767 [Ostrinia furnacalis]
MKTLKVVLSAIVLLYLVENAKCGIPRPDLAREIELEEEEAIYEAKSGILDKLIDTLISGYEAAGQILQDLLNNDNDEGPLDSLYQKLKEALKKLQEYIMGGKPTVSEEVEEARKAIVRLIEEHKRIHTTSKTIVDGAVESAKKAKLAQKIVNEGPDVVRHRVYEIDRALKDHVFEGAKKPIALANNDVNHEHVEDTFKSSVDFLQEKGIKLSDEEKELLEGISRRVHDSLMRHVKEQ